MDNGSLEKVREESGVIPTKSTCAKRFCFWVVAPGSAKAKRISCSVNSVVYSGLCVVFAIGLIGFALGDYARAQFGRARTYFHVLSLAREREALLRSNSELQLRLKVLSSDASRSETIGQGLKARLDELAAVVGNLKSIDSSLEAAPAAGALSAPGAKAQFSHEGIGGAEIECEGNPDGCVSLGINGGGLADSALKLDLDSQAALMPELSAMRKSSLSPEMGEALDHYIELLRTLPFSAPAAGRVSSGFGFRHSPFTGGVSVHEGIDFSLPLGSHVYATGDGIVREVRWNDTYGLVVDIEHSPRIVTRYAHLKRAFVTEGERVCRGETIALSGSTGRATGPHLHYEVRVDGQAKNPDQLLAAGTRLAALF